MKKNYLFKKNYLLFSLIIFLGLLQTVQAGNAYSFEVNGTSESIYLASADGLNVTNNWTFETWINVDGVSGYDDFMHRDGIFSFQVKNPLGTGDFAVDFYNRDNTEQLTTDAAEDLDFDTWYHIAATFDGTTAKLFINGTMVDSDATAANWTLQANSNNLNIGARYASGYGSYYDGELDEIRISNIARDINDMQTDYSREEYIVDANTLLLMHFNNQGSPPTYETGTGYSGTVYNHNTGTANYVFTTIAAAKLLRPEYQSKTTGNWSDSTSWQYYNGTTTSFQDATLSPNSYDDVITILTSHTITIDDDISFNQTYINAGSQITIADTASATITNGDSTDLEVAGTFRKDGVLLQTGSPLVDILNGGLYQHNSDASISTATWNTGSTCEVIGVGSGTTFLELGNLGQNFYNFTWNSSTQNRDVGLQGLTTIAGDFNMQYTNAKDVRLVTSATNKTLGIAGNFLMSGGKLELTNGNGNCYFVCYGDYTQTSGYIQGQGGTGTGEGYLRFGPIDGSGTHSGTFTQSSGTFEPDNIQINSSYTLILATDMNTGAAPMTLNGHLTVPSGITLTIGTTFKVSSTQNFTGSLINNGSVAGDVDAECHTTAGQWHGISAPVDNQTANALFLNNNPTVWMKSYNEADKTYPWVTSLGTDLGDMAGWMVFIDGSVAQTYNFNGPVRSGTIGSADNLIRTSDTTGYNFVGNPFTSAIDWDAGTGWLKSNLNNATYVYNNGNWATYIAGAGANGGSRYIAMNQGFFVQVSDGGSYPENGTLQMTSDVCVHNDTTPFLKSTQDADQQIIKLQLSDNAFTDETVIRITDDATTGWDGNLDAHKLFSFNEDYPQIYSTANGNMSINSLPGSVETIPINVTGSDGNQMTISALETGDFEQVLLYDEFLEELADLSTGDYTFTYSNDVTDRFLLSFIFTGIEDEVTTQVNFFNTYAVHNEIIVVLQDGDMANISVYNLLGQEIIHSTVNSSKSSFTVNKSGYYLVTVNNGSQLATQKVFVNK